MVKCDFCKKYYPKDECRIDEGGVKSGHYAVDSFGEIMPMNYKRVICGDCLIKIDELTIKQNAKMSGCQ